MAATGGQLKSAAAQLLLFERRIIHCPVASLYVALEVDNMLSEAPQPTFVDLA